MEEPDGTIRMHEFPGTKSKRETEAMLKAALEEYNETGRLFDSGQVTVAELMDEWYAVEIEPSPRASTTRDSYRNVMDHIRNHPIGEMRLKDVMDYLFTTFDEDAQSAKGNSIQIWSLTTTAIYLGKNVQLIRYLLDHGGKIDYNSSYSGQSFYDYCHEEGRESILSVIEENGGFPEDIED